VQVKHANGLMDQLLVAAMQPQGEALPFMTMLMQGFTLLEGPTQPQWEGQQQSSSRFPILVRRPVTGVTP
jgi:hypothetical protein